MAAHSQRFVYRTFFYKKNSGYNALNREVKNMVLLHFHFYTSSGRRRVWLCARLHGCRVLSAFRVWWAFVWWVVSLGIFLIGENFWKSCSEACGFVRPLRQFFLQWTFKFVRFFLNFSELTGHIRREKESAISWVLCVLVLALALGATDLIRSLTNQPVLFLTISLNHHIAANRKWPLTGFWCSAPCASRLATVFTCQFLTAIPCKVPIRAMTNVAVRVDAFRISWMPRSEVWFR